ncbi:MAG: CusA/CzcA family heavy metal efflux RND transporter [candidate division Zixibacteria bacterium 4484_95]|nr:MAG: CusA/CzcA family heavy metal efflux RND transporter [candidate division Zixibacteria bacterium 4484_95]
MINTIIEYSVKNKWLIITLTAIIIVLSLYTFKEIAIDAIPDLSDVQVIIQTKYGGQPPQIVEDQVTYPLSTAMLAVPKAKSVRGYSYFGLSFIYVIFEDGTDLYWARSRVLESLSAISSRLPDGVMPELGPDATGVGWIFQYVLIDSSGNYDLSELRSIQDWFLKYELSTVPGVSEVASVGGFIRQYQIEVDPGKLDYFGIPLSHVISAVKKSNSAVGGRLLELGETEYMVRSLAYIGDLEDLKNIPVHTPKDSPPILLSSVANIQYGPEIRRGLVELNGQGEIVGGIVIMRWGDNAREVITKVKEKLKELKSGLPGGIEIIPVYDRSGLIDRAVGNLQYTLLKEILVVIAITLLFLLHVRSTLIAVFTLPAGVLISILLMHLLGINANIMSLGGIAIAIGVMVDASVVMVENAHKHIERNRGKKERTQIIIDSAKEVGPALFFSLLIITISFLPVLVLQGQSGRLFKPLAFTKTFAIAASALVSITVIPALTVIFVKGKVISESRNPFSKFAIKLYRPIISFVLNHRATVILVSVVLLILTAVPVLKIGSEFMPPLYEGDLLYMPTTLPGISITKAKEILQQTDKIIASFPEVEQVFGKIGRAETATDPAPLTMIETTIMLKPEAQWRSGVTPEMLVDSLDRAIQFPGLTNAWTMPIKTRIDMLATGIKTPVGIKVMGSNLDSLNAIAQRIEAVVRKIKGTRSVYAERVTGGNYLDIDIDRFKAAAYGLKIDDIQNIIKSAIGGMNITQTIEGLERYPVNIRYPREFRDSPDAIRQVLIDTPNGGKIPLGQVALIDFKKGAVMIKTENARPTAWVYVDIDNIDVGTYVKTARNAVEKNIKIPPGYSIVWSGQYENMQAVAEKLKVIIPLTLVVILLLLFLHFKNLANSLIVMLSLPFALVGGIWLFYIFGYNTSVAVYVGFIALAGLAAETGVVMLVYLEEAVKRYRKEEKLKSKSDLHAAVMEGAVERVRPKLMTVSTTIIALLPIMFGHGTGSEIMQRIAAPMIGGLISSTILTLIIVPVLFYIVKVRDITNIKDN